MSLLWLLLVLTTSPLVVDVSMLLPLLLPLLLLLLLLLELPTMVMLLDMEGSTRDRETRTPDSQM